MSNKRPTIIKITSLKEESCSFCNIGHCESCLHDHTIPRKTYFTKDDGLPFRIIKGCGCEDLGHIQRKKEELKK